jgi:hypothetical protein
MARDYVPVADAKLLEWLTNIKKGVSHQGAQWNLSPAEIAQAEQYCDEYIAQIKASHAARIAAKAAVGGKKNMRKTHLRPLRKLISKVKGQPNFSKINSLEAPVWSHKEVLETDNYVPKLKASVASGFVEVRFRKHGVIQGMQFRIHIGDEPKGDWKTLPMRLYSPLRYKPEGYPVGSIIRVWIVGRAMVKDELVGVESDPISVVYVVE